MARTSTLLARRDIGSIDDLKASLEWIDGLLETTARRELELEQARGNLLDPTIFVDGKKSTAIAGAKLFGSVVMVDSVGPIAAAIRAAEALVEQAAPYQTGHYRSALVWLVNGRPVAGTPSAEAVGPHGNAMLIDLAPYASWLEVELPSGVLWGAFTRLKRQFGKRVAVGYHYARPAWFGGHRWQEGAKRGHDYMVPFIVIGSPGSTVTTAADKPGPSGKRRGRPRSSSRKVGRGHRESRGIGRGSVKS